MGRPRGGGGAAGRHAWAGLSWNLVAGSLEKKGWGLVALRSKTVWPVEQSWPSCQGFELVGRGKKEKRRTWGIVGKERRLQG